VVAIVHSENQDINNRKKSIRQLIAPFYRLSAIGLGLWEILARVIVKEVYAAPEPFKKKKEAVNKLLKGGVK
jgi:hypothetical protein